MIRKILTVMSVGASLLFGGVNSTALFHVDMVATSESVENIQNTSELNQEFSVAIWVENVVNVKSFSVRLKIDNSKLEYISSAEDISGRKNIIDGGMFFDDENAGLIEYVGSIQGDGSTSTSGLLGVITFKSKLGMDEQAVIEFYDATLSDDENILDEFTSPLGAFNKGFYSVGTTAIKSGFNINSKLLNNYVTFSGNDVLFDAGKVNHNTTLSLVNPKGAIVFQYSLSEGKKNVSLNKISGEIPSGYYFGILKVRNEKIVFKYTKK